ncbi:MAG: hypothetical protein OSB70_07845 [Myxococcota bacterium]|jgi:hypothetical protein|nr:hypothetical protein [Myxococcota bacterium]
MTTKRTLGIQFVITALALGATPWLLKDAADRTVESPETATSPAAIVQVVDMPTAAEEIDQIPEDNDISFEAYVDKFGALTVMDLRTRTLRDGVSSQIREEMVGTEVTWDGYVNRVADAAAGGGTLVLGIREGATGLDAALVRVSPELYDEVQGYQAGDHMRVVARFDGLKTIFPLLSGKSFELLSNQ